MEKKNSFNIPLIVITGFGILLTLFFVYYFTYNKAVDTVRENLVIQRAYPKIKPQEFINQLPYIASEEGFSINQIHNNESSFIITLYSPKEIEKALSIGPMATAYTVLTFVIYDLGNGTAVIGYNPYIWDIIYENRVLDEMAQQYSENIIKIFDRTYLTIKEKRKSI